MLCHPISVYQEIGVISGAINHLSRLPIISSNAAFHPEGCSMLVHSPRCFRI